MANMTDSTSTGSVNRHALTAVEKQRSQLEKLLKDPAKPVYIPPPPKEKTIRPAREMMKNVQGSSAGAGSGEFHVYKAGRRREYERLKLLEEASLKEIEEAEFEKKRRETEEIANAKTAKNRAKRQKKKERSKNKAGREEGASTLNESTTRRPSDAPLKKRRLVNGEELVFRRPTEGSEDDSDEDEQRVPVLQKVDEHRSSISVHGSTPENLPNVIETARILIVEDD